VHLDRRFRLDSLHSRWMYTLARMETFLKKYLQPESKMPPTLP
jgi:hypothetical protein